MSSASDLDLGTGYLDKEEGVVDERVSSLVTASFEGSIKRS